MSDTFDKGMSVRRAVLGDAHVDRAEATKTDFDASCRVALNWALPQFVWRNGSILARNNSGPARPYMARLRVFRRLI
jgi:4-carboxymuconolactone decarboxylase